MNKRKHILNFVFAIVIGVVFLFAGLAVSFVLIRMLIPDPVMAIYPPGPFDPLVYQALAQQYGFDQPIFIQFFRFILDLFSGNWGYSNRIAVGMPVSTMLSTSFPRTIELLILPLVIAVNLGYLFGKVSKRSKRNWLKSGFELLGLVSLAVPIFVFGMFLQFYLGYVVDVFPVVGYKNFAFPDPPFVTGYRILDSLLAGRIDLAVDTMVHYILPMIVLTVLFTALLTRAFSSQMNEDAYKEKTILSNTAKTSAIFGIIFAFLMIIDLNFNLIGYAYRFYVALYLSDYFVISACVFLLIILFLITILISNITFSLIRLIRDLRSKTIEVEMSTDTEMERESKAPIIVDLKSYSKKLIRSPLTIIGLVAILIPIIVSIFAELISGYSFAGALVIEAGSWNPPSPDHPLGQTEFGRDVLALTLYGAGDALIFGIGATSIALAGGLIFGLVAQLHRIVNKLVMSVILIFYILPGIILVMFSILIGGMEFGLIMITTGLLLIPSFTRIIANAEFRIVPIGKKILAYIPLFMGVSISFYLLLGFLGLSDPYTIQLGDQILDARMHMFDAPWASFWPGLAAFLIILSFFVLYKGLAEHSR
jgi:ABC-type dipeptide/oligopeptide/nickel transport system permease component